MTGSDSEDELLDAALREFVGDLFFLDDLGLWELTSEAAGRTKRLAAAHVDWARTNIARLMAAGMVRLFVTSWPSMQLRVELHTADLSGLAPEDWYDPSAATTVVVAAASGERPAVGPDGVVLPSL